MATDTKTGCSRTGPVSVLSACLLAVCLAGVSSGAEGGEAKRAYDSAYGLEQKGELTRAAEAYRKVLTDYPESAVKLAALSQLAGVLAALGRTDEAYQTYVRYIRDDLAAAHTPPAERPSLEVIGAQARWKVARALLGSRRSDRYLAARAQCETLIRDFPGSTLASHANRRITRLNTEIERERMQAQRKEAIAAVIDAYAAALSQKNQAAALALLAAPPIDDALRDRLQRYFGSERHKAYTYKIKRMRFSPDMSKATVLTDALAPNEQAASKLFRLVKTAEGWKLERL